MLICDLCGSTEGVEHCPVCELDYCEECALIEKVDGEGGYLPLYIRDVCPGCKYAHFGGEVIEN